MNWKMSSEEVLFKSMPRQVPSLLQFLLHDKLHTATQEVSNTKFKRDMGM